MRLRLAARSIPGRIASGAFIAHAGWDKWHGSPEQATGVHGMAVGAFPQLEPIPPAVFLKLLAAGEMATGTVLLSPFASTETAGAALTGFSGTLLTMYWRTPSLRKPGSIWPTQAGTAISKDIWMLGIGLGLLVDALTARRRDR
jgi:DoxX